MKAIINKKEYELSHFAVLLRSPVGEPPVNMMEECRRVSGELNHRGTCEHVRTNSDMVFFPVQERRMEVVFSDPCIAEETTVAEPSNDGAEPRCAENQQPKK